MTRPIQSAREILLRWKRVVLSAIVLLFVTFVLSVVFSYESTTTSAVATEAIETLEASQHHRKVVVTIANLASRYHYREKELTNDFSEEILNEYLNILDPQKRFFLASDVSSFSSNKIYFDNYLLEGDLREIFVIFRVFQARVEERSRYAKSMLDFPLDFGLDEIIELNRSQEEWSNSQEEYDGLWRRLVKNDILTLKLNDTDPEKIKETLYSRYNRLHQRTAKYNSEDVIEIFLNSYLSLIDPHSAYYSPHSSDNLAIQLSQQIEGIGATLITENDHTVIHSVITGGPAELSNKLKSGDKIIGVRNGDESEFTDIIGWRIRDVVDMIRGPKGTTVHLRIIPADALSESSFEDVAIVRDRVKFEEQMARKSLFQIEANGRILQLGVITLPTFYSELYESNDKNARSSSRDVKRLLHELNDQQIDGLVMDLRGNGGGALQEAVNLTGLFIRSGPVVQVEDAKGKIHIQSDTDGAIDYKGPLVVLIDRHSASASEIFAAAIQDYRRGIIIGETSYGKGVVQTLWPLARWLKRDNSGTVKLSTAQFYRINGKGTQHSGVLPDILFATNEFVSDFGERSLRNAILPNQIASAKSVNLWHNAAYLENRISELRRLNSERSRYNPIVNYLVKREEYAKIRNEQQFMYLNEEKRRQSVESSLLDELSILNSLRLKLGMDAVDEILDETFVAMNLDDVYQDMALSVLSDLITIDIDGVQQAQQFQ